MSGQSFGDRSFHQVHWLPPPLITDIDRASINFIGPSITKKTGSVNNKLNNFEPIFGAFLQIGRHDFIQ
jgi:hypothetical protein